MALLLAGLAVGSTATAAADGLPADPPPVRYTIEAKVDPATRQLSGRVALRWTNPSGSLIVSRVPLHLYLNAFSHTATTWMREVRAFAGFRFNSADLLRMYPDPWGHVAPVRIEQLQRQGGARSVTTVRWRPIQPDDGNPLDRTLIEVTLARPVPPGGALELVITFAGRLPVPIARTGCAEGFCLLGQWFPKIGVLLPEGAGRPVARWAARQFHGPTEFFADFADYDVTIDAPAGWIVGASGRRRPPRLDQAGAAPAGYQRVRYTQRWVHDVAVVLGRDLLDRAIVHRPAGGGGPPVRVRYLLPRAAGHQLARARRAVEGALDCYGRRLGPYPYTDLTVVLPPHRAIRTGGMEYPTLITGASADALWDGVPLGQTLLPEHTLVHELGHQYFYGLLASDEQEEALLDEGLTSHWDGQCMREVFGREASLGRVLGRALDAPEAYTINLARGGMHLRESPRQRPSSLFYPGTPFLQIYSRPALILWTASGLFGQRRMDRVFASYLRRHRFGHPTTDDFLAAAGEAGGPELGAFLTEALDTARVPDFRVVSLNARRARAPLGRIERGAGGTVVITAADRDSRRPLPRELVPGRAPPGALRVQITDPGWSRGGQSQRGAVRWIDLRRRGVPAGGGVAGGGGLHESTALIEGPAWDHLPAEVVLRFADGVELAETWDGKAAWRGYRVIHGAPLTTIQIDRTRRLLVDVQPQNNARALEADPRFTADWGGWLVALTQWLAEGVSLWL